MNRTKRCAAGLAAALALTGAMPLQTRADFVPTASGLNRSTLPPAGCSLASDHEALQNALSARDAKEVSCGPEEAPLAALVLLIGDVPSVRLRLPDQTDSFPSSLPGVTTVPSDSPAPSDAPEPATWILGLIGSGLAGLVSRLRRQSAL